jgi:hypothetical protein
MTRYSIMVTEYGSDHAVELVRVGSNPQAIVEGLRKKTLTIRRSIYDAGARQVKMPKYTFISIVDHEAS